jgi:hypothetical protein
MSFAYDAKVMKREERMVTHTEVEARAGRLRLNTPAALGFGAVFVIVGLAGFFVSGSHDAVGTNGGDLFGLFRVNVLHNLVHVALGAVLVAAGILGGRPAKVVNTLVGSGYLLLFGVGLVVAGTGANVLALNGADHVLHLVLGLVLAAVGLGADRVHS